MANSEGFWSYVHADDEAEGGRILRLARDVAGQFEMLTGEPLTLFLDKDAIKWSDNPSKRASLIASECAQDGVVVLFVYLFQLFPNLARNASAVLPCQNSISQQFNLCLSLFFQTNCFLFAPACLDPRCRNNFLLNFWQILRSVARRASILFSRTKRRGRATRAQS